MANSQCRWKAPNQWDEWSEWLAAGLHARNRWRLPVLFMGMLFASGRRTVTSWLRAAGVTDDFQDYYYFLAAVGRKINPIATQLVILILKTLPLPKRLLLVLDDSPTKRYGPKVEERTSITTPHQVLPINRISTDMFGSPFRWHCGIRNGARLACRCERCFMFANVRWRQFPISGIGIGLPRSSNWRRDWSSGSFLS
jgi:hypothetical protein